MTSFLFPRKQARDKLTQTQDCSLAHSASTLKQILFDFACRINIQNYQYNLVNWFFLTDKADCLIW